MGKRTGFNEETSKNLILGAGALFVNFDVTTDTYETAKAKLLGATSGGTKFNASADYRDIKVDGLTGKVKGMSILESWEVTLETSLIEFKEETFKHALASVKTATETISLKEYTKLEANDRVSDADYLDNITFIGTISGSTDPIIIQVFNALHKEGLNIEFKDSDDVVAELKFEGHYDADEFHYDADNAGTAPFAIYYPKKVA